MGAHWYFASPELATESAMAPVAERRECRAADLRALRANPTSFLSVPPTNVHALLLDFFHLRTPPHVPNPTRLAEVAQIKLEHGVAFVEHLCVTPRGTFVLCFGPHNTVIELSRTGAVIKNIGQHGEHGYPSACVVSAAGLFYVIQSLANCVRVFDERSFRVNEFGADCLRNPIGVDLSRDEALLYVTSRGNDLLCVFDTGSGTLLSKHCVVAPRGVAVLQSGRIAVSSQGSHPSVSGDIFELNEDCSLRRMHGLSAGRICHGLVVDRDNNFYVELAKGSGVAVYSAYLSKCVGHFTQQPGATAQECVALCQDGTVVRYGTDRLHLFRGDAQQWQQ